MSLRWSPLAGGRLPSLYTGGITPVYRGRSVTQQEDTSRGIGKKRVLVIVAFAYRAIAHRVRNLVVNGLEAQNESTSGSAS